MALSGLKRIAQLVGTKGVEEEDKKARAAT